MTRIDVKVDGARYTDEVEPRMLLVHYLRYGDAATTAKTAREFKVFYQKVKGSGPDSYTMDHTAGSYVFDTQGRLRLFVRHSGDPEPLAADIKSLLATAG